MARSHWNRELILRSAFPQNGALVMNDRFLIAFALSALAASAVAAEIPPDRIFRNGKIVTVDDSFSVAEAFAVRGDRILAVGSNEEVSSLAGAETQSVDLQGATVLPGLIDSHVHSTGAAVFEFEHEVPEMDTVEDVLAYIAERAETAQDGEWILLSQVFITRLQERRFPTREEMDRVAPKNPVVFRTGPDAAVNSLALELSGIDADFTLPEGSNTRIERHPETNEPTGVIRSHGGVIKVPPRSGGEGPDFEERVAALKELFADYNRVGLTGLADRNVSDSSIRLYQALRERGELTCRSYLYHGLGASGDIQSIRKNLDQIAEHPLREKDDLLWLRGVKIFLDGGMLTGSAYMKEPWGLSESYGIVDPEYRGVRYVEPDKLYEMAKHALSKDLQFTAHAVGDAAVETLVDAYARIAEDDFPVREHRPCVTHCNFMSESAIRKMAKYGIVADLQPAWLYLDGATLTAHFGEERLTWFQPYRTIFDQEVIVGGGSDHMQKIGDLRSVNPYNPFLGMWIAVTRHARRMDEALHPEQKISREEAIRLYTINNAYVTFSEEDRGTLEAGKLADFIVLDRDILTCPEDEIREIQVEQTWLGGQSVYAAARPPASVDAENFNSLQEAFDALPDSGGVVRLPPGIFEISEPLAITTPETRIEGAGASTHIVNRSEEGKPALIVQPEGYETDAKLRMWRVQLGNFRISGNEKSGDGILANGVQEIFVQGVSVDRHGGNGIALVNCYEDPRVSDSILTYNKKAGLYIEAGHDIVVNANHFEENGDAVFCTDSFNLCMNGNNVDDHLGNGVVIENTYGSVVSGNMIEECQGTAIILDRDCYGITLSANVIAHDMEGGIDLRDAHGCTVSANTFTLVHRHSVRVGPNSGRIVVSGNNFSNSHIGDGQTKRPVEHEKPISRDAATGVVIEGARLVTVSGNSFTGIAGSAVRGDAATEKCLVSGNAISDFARTEKDAPAIDLPEGKGHILEGNLVDE